MKKAIIITTIMVVVLAVGIFLAMQDSKPYVGNDLDSVPTSQQTLNNLQKAGLQALSTEGTVFHIHQHLDMTINGLEREIPSNLGVGTAFISEVHTHDESGIIHVEANEQKDFKLGQFFDMWGIDFNDSCIATYCADGDSKLVVAINGQPITNVKDHVLKEHEQIHVWYGPKEREPQIKKEYQFPEGL
jgi:hypothetical protein